MVSLKVVHPLKVYQYTKFHGPTLTGASFQKFERPPFWNGWSYGIKKYGVEVTFNGMTSILNFIRMYHLFQKLLGGTHKQTDGQTDWWSHKPHFPFKASRLKTDLCNGEMLCSLCGTNWILKYYSDELIVTKLPRVTSIEILHEKTGMETIKSHVRKLACKLHFKSQYSENAQIRRLDQYDPIFDKHKRPRALLVDWSVVRRSVHIYHIIYNQ
jgi:uncharacterized Zn-finger protein